MVVADLDFVLEEDDAIIYDLVRSNRPDKYEKADKPPHIEAKLSDVIDCEPLSSGGNLHVRL